MGPQPLANGRGGGGGGGGFFGGLFRRPLHKFVAQTVAVTLVAGVAFHFAIDNMLATRAPQGRPRHDAVEAVWAEDDEQRRRRLQREREEAEAAARGPVANQNLAFRRFLADLEHKDTKTKIEEAAQAMDYFVRGPQAVEADVALRRVHRPTDPLSSPFAGDGDAQQPTG